jgi:hypothetical protein
MSAPGVSRDPKGRRRAIEARPTREHHVWHLQCKEAEE